MKTLLAVTAHPDDESFLFGGLLAQHARAGGRAGLLCLTDGQAGRTGGLCTREELPEVRASEMRRAVAVLGIKDLFMPGLTDGALDRIDDAEGARIVADYIDRYGADELYTFGPEGASGHEDHKACWRWTTAAAGGRPVYAATFPESVEPPGGTPLPITRVVDVSELGDLKRRAFLEHRTQQDHLELFDEILTKFDGREYYHLVAAPSGHNRTVDPAT